MLRNRRQFLESAALASLGLSYGKIAQAGDRLGQRLAQPVGLGPGGRTPRKLALLVGINAYPLNGIFSNLQGCLTDVELQRQLLIHRFGFLPADILVLTDAQATRQNILAAFETHLIQQAKPNDIALFHFSGHGSQVVDPDRDFADGLNSTLVPVDAVLPGQFPLQGGEVQDITGHTLYLLAQAMPTDNFTLVLDSCHSGGGLRGGLVGNLRVRSRAGGPQLRASAAELTYQQQWREKLQLSPEEFRRGRRAGIAKGVAIAATKRDQLAADAPFNDFYAGAFTYTLTQYLWQQTGPLSVKIALGDVGRATTNISTSSQEPVFEQALAQRQSPTPFYFSPLATAEADAVITAIQGDQAELWLGGLSPQSLEAFTQGGEFRTPQGLRLLLQSRQGLVGQAKILGPRPGAALGQALAGTLVREAARQLPPDLELRLGLDPSLGTDQATVRQVLSVIPQIQPQLLGQGEVHYIFSRLTPELAQRLSPAIAAQTHQPALGSCGLLSPAGAIVPDSFGPATETLAGAIARLQPKFKALLAARVVKLLLNGHSSQLRLRATLTSQQQPTQVLNPQLQASPPIFVEARTFEIRSAAPQPSQPQVPLGTPLKLQVHNQENQPLYVAIFVIDTSGAMTVLYPNQWNASAASMLLEAGQTLRLPDSNSFSLVAQAPKGPTEVLILASKTPLEASLLALQTLATQQQIARGPVTVSAPDQFTPALLKDLGQMHRSGATGSGATSSEAISSGVTGSGVTISSTAIAGLLISFDVI